MTQQRLLEQNANPNPPTPPMENGEIPTQEGSASCALPENAGTPQCQPLMNADGSLNCAHPMNTVLPACMDLFNASQSGPLNCALPELQNMPVCKGNGAMAPKIEQNSVAAPVQNFSQPQVIASVPTLAVEPKKPETPSAARNKEDSFDDIDGEEEEPSAKLQVSFNQNQKRYIIRVDCNLAGEKLTLRATKKGAKSLRFTINIDEDGVGGIRTKSRLSGYTLSVYYGSAKLDQVKV